MPRVGRSVLILGVLNVTPDSFSDGGLYDTLEKAYDHVSQMMAEGMDILDIGAVSTRPGVTPVGSAEEQRRLLPALKALRAAFPELPVSVDTYNSDTARMAIEAGADIINDIRGLQEGLRRDQRSPMALVAAELGCPLILMHSRDLRRFSGDLMNAILEDLEISIRLAEEAGLPRSQLWLDPGFGFGKTPLQNVELMRRLGELGRYRLPILLGASRKVTLGLITGAPPQERLEGTLATTALAFLAGVGMVRVHDVGPNRRLLDTLEAFRAGPAESARIFPGLTQVPVHTGFLGTCPSENSTHD